MGSLGQAKAPNTIRAASSHVRVIDGDTLDLAGTRVRLFGIDAPESKQTCRDKSNVVYLCGQTVTKALRDLVRDKDISCEQRDIDRYKRVVAVCHAGSSNVNEWMVHQGHAVAYRKYSWDYVAAEDEAKREKRGLWAGTFTSPEQFRKRR